MRGEKRRRSRREKGAAEGDARGLYRGCKHRHCKANPPL